MKLLTDELKDSLPEIYSQDGKGDDATVHAKFFCPWNHWTWFVTEYDKENNICFGFVAGDFPELGEFSVAELESVQGPLGLGIERDLYFTPKTLKECKAALSL